MKLIALFLLVPTLICAQQEETTPILHSYIFCNTVDTSIGSSCIQDYLNIQKEIKVIADAIGYASKMHSFIGLDFKTANLYTIPDNEKVGDSDIVIMYFSSHGGRIISDSSEFPNIIFPQRNEQFVNAESIHDTFKTKLHPKLLITVIDACNSFFDGSENEIIHLKSAYNHQYPTIKRESIELLT